MDQPIEKALKKAIKKTRWMQWLILVPVTIVGVIIVTIVAVIGLYIVGNKVSSVQHAQLHERLFLVNRLTQPNINIDSQVTRDGSMFGGTLVTNRSKDINGYLVAWSTLESQYTWIQSKIDQNELIPGFYSHGKHTYEYDKQSKQMIASFYHPDVKTYYDDAKNQLPQLLQMENHMAEVAISFEKPLTFAQVKEIVPSQLNMVWFYMVSRADPERSLPSGLQKYGYRDESMSEAGYRQFIKDLQSYHSTYAEPYMQTYINEGLNKSINEVKVLGVMLTGKTEYFAPLMDQEAVRGASVGVTVPIVPYKKPTKE